MAGRGKDAVVPAWLKGSGSGSGVVPGASSETSGPSIPRKPSAGQRRSRSRSPADRELKRRRSRSRSYERERRRDRSRSRSRSYSRDRRRRSSSRDRSRSRSPPGRGSSSAPLPVAVLASSIGAKPAAAASAAPTDTRQLIQAAMVSASLGAATGDMVRKAKRLYVGNLPTTSDAEVSKYFNDVICKVYQPGQHVVSAYVHPDKSFAFLEMHDLAVTTACLQLDGIQFKGQTLRVRRPHDFNPAAAPALPTGVPFRLEELGKVATTVPDGPNKLFIGGLPYQLTEGQLIELLQVFGRLKGMHLVRDPGSVTSKGYAFCEFVDPSVSEICMAALYQVELGGKTMTVRRANPQGQGPNNVSPMMSAAGVAMPMMTSGVPTGGMDIASIAAAAVLAATGMNGTVGSSMPPPPSSSSYEAPPPPLPSPTASSIAAADAVQPPVPPADSSDLAPAPVPPPPSSSPSGGAVSTRAIRLRNMVAPSELEDDAEYADITADVNEELGKYGQVERMAIPRTGPAAGNIFALFASAEQASNASRALAGRLFAGSTITVEFEQEGVFETL